MKDISKRIKELRMERNMTQDDLAERLHVTRQTVSSWETKKTRPDVEMLETIAQVFEIELTELLYGKRKEHRFEGVRSNGPSNPKMVRQAKLFGIVFVVGFLARFLIPIFVMVLSQLFGGSVVGAQISVTIGMLLIGNWSFACLGPFVLSLISIKRDISIKSVIWRKRIFVIGVVLAVMAVLSWPLWIAYSQFELFEVGSMVSTAMVFMTWGIFSNPYVLAAIASLIWLGKKEPRIDKENSSM